MSLLGQFIMSPDTANGTQGIIDFSAMTFAQLRRLLPSTEGLPLPTFKALREAKPEVFTKAETEDGILSVFRDGFFTYETRNGHVTVYAVDRCARIVLNPMEDGHLSILDESNFGDCPWPKVLEFAANERIVGNISRNAERQEVLSLDAVDEDWDMRLTVQPDFERRLEEEEISLEESRKLQAALANLTDRQREVLKLYFIDGLTQVDITVCLDVDKSTVSTTRIGPTYKSKGKELFRGLKNDGGDYAKKLLALSVGDTFDLEMASSFSSTIERSESFAGYRGIMLHISDSDITDAPSIKGISQYPFEDEILVDDRMWIVTKTEDMGDRRRHIWMRRKQ